MNVFCFGPHLRSEGGGFFCYQWLDFNKEIAVRPDFGRPNHVRHSRHPKRRNANMRKMSLMLMVLSANLFAQDSTRTVQLPEVTVTATRSLINALDSPSPVDVIRIEESASLFGAHAGDALRSTNSVFLQDLGGSAALKTVFLRGTAPQHLLVMVNGVRQNSFQNGLVDLSLLPLNDVQTIEIVRGGSSALYGADALGGVVNILTRSATPEFRMRAEIGAGSFGYRRWKVEGQGRPGVMGLVAGVAYEEAEDEFPFTVGGERQAFKRMNADFERTNAYLHGDARIGAQTFARISSQAVRSRRGVPGSLAFPSGAARQADDDLNLNLDLRNGSFSGVELALKTSYHFNLQTYRDPDAFFPIDATYRNGQIAVNPELHLTVGETGRVLLGVEWDEGFLKGNDFEGVIRRTQRSVYISNEWRFAYDRSSWDLISVYGMVRYDAISDVDDVVMPKVGFNVRVLREGDIRLRASFGRSFRSPSFNDLYYVGFSNPNLRPEYSTGADVGVVSEIRHPGSTHRFGLTYFDIRTRDRILFDLSTFLPMNIGKVVSTGIEGMYAGEFLNGLVTVELNYSLVDAVKRNRTSGTDPSFGKQLVFIPQHSLHGRASLFLDAVSLSIGHTAAGKRFITDDHLSDLPEHHLTDLRATTKFRLGRSTVTLGGEMRNVFNRSYEVFPDYPMPGRALRIGMSFDY